MKDNLLNISGIESLFGDSYRPLDNQTESEIQEQIQKEGYIKLEDDGKTSYFIKPNSPLNAKLLTSVATGYNLWSNVLPFENEFIAEQIDSILDISGKDKNTSASLDLTYKVMSNMKDFIYSYSNIGIFNNMEKERLSLFKDSKSENTKSLANYLNTLRRENSEIF